MAGRGAWSEPVVISYDLTTRATAERQIEIVLRLFREGICILTKPIHTVSRKDVDYVLSRCRINLAARGFPQFEDDDSGLADLRKRAA